MLCFFHFDPSIAFAAVVAVLFFIAGALAFYQTRKFGGGPMMKVLVGSCWAEMLGYILRIVAIEDITLTNYILTTLFILITPIFIALIAYLVIGHILRRVGKPIKVLCKTFTAESIARFFVASDVACFFLQATGGSMLAIQDTNTQNLGKAIVVGSLVIQLAFFTAFTYIVYRVNFDEAYLCKNVLALNPVFICLWCTIILLYIRNIYRTIEFSSGWTSYVDTNEWCFMAFESVPILLACYTLSAFHFGRLMEFKSLEKALWIVQVEEARVLYDQGSTKTRDTSVQIPDTLIEP